MSTPDLTALVVDDEALARDELRYLLGQLGGITVTGQADNGLEALDAVARLRPDVVFLDLQMPGLTGLEAAHRLAAEPACPALVFVTAYDERAVEAFEVNAVDYLLKPVELSRLERAVTRVRRRQSGDAPTRPQIDALLRLAGEANKRQTRLALRVGQRFVLVQADDIIYASLVDDSITIVTGQVSGTSNLRTLDELQSALDPAVFWRVHRSHLVNINKIKEIVPWFSRNYILRMNDSTATEIPVSRAQTRRLREYLKL